MAITYVGAGTAVYSTGNPAPTAPSHNVGDLLILAIGTKPDSTPATQPAGWEILGSASGGVGSQGIDTGPMRVGLFYRIATGSGTAAEDNPGTVTITGNNISSAQIFVFRAGAGNVFDIAGVGAADTTTGTNFAAAMPSNPGITVGDMLFAVGVIPTDVTTPAQFSAQNVAAAGLTTVNLTEIGEWDTSSGQDMGGWQGYGAVVTGTASGNPTVSSTAGGTTTNVAGPIYLVRMRELPAQASKSASDTGTLSATDSSSLSINAQKTASDTGTLSATDSSSVAPVISKSASDSGTLSATEKVRYTITQNAGLGEYVAYDFEEGSSTTANDSGSAGITLTGVDGWTTGKNGDFALSGENFNGANLVLPSSLGTTWTVMMWAKVDGALDWTSFWEGPSAIFLEVNASRVLDYNHDPIGTLNSGMTLALGTWYHLTVTSEAGVGTKLIVNAVTKASSATAATLPSGTFLIGGSGLQPLAGAIDDFRIFSGTALTEAQIADAMATPVGSGASTVTDVFGSEDSGTLSAVDTSSVDFGATPISANDSGTLSAVESSSITFVSVFASDSGTISATEGRSSSGTVSASDSGTISATDSTSAFFKAIGVSDAGTLSATESATISTTISSSDSGTISATDSGSWQIPAPTLYEEIMADSPSGYWPMDETSGATAADASGNANDVTWNGTFTRNQTSLQTSGVGKSVGVGQFGTASGRTTATFDSTQFSLVSLVNTNGGAVAARDTTIAGGRAFQFRINSNGSLLLNWWDTSGTLRSITSTAGDYTLLTSAIVGFTISTTTVNLYVGGTIVATGSSFGGLVGGVTTPLWLAAINNDSTRLTYFQDDTAVWTSVIPQSRIAAYAAAASSSGGYIPVTASDSGTISATESRSSAGTVTSSDAGTLSATDARQPVSVTTSVTDSGTLSATESASTVVAITSGDSGTLSATDASIQTRASFTSTDTGTLSATESVSSSGTVVATDTGTISATESAGLSVTQTATDTGTISATETTDIVVAGVIDKSASDSGTISATESTSLQILTVVTASDSGTFSATEGRSSAGTMSRTDTGTISATESRTLAASSTRTDSGTLSATETAVVFNDRPGADSGTLSATESVDIVITGTFIKSASDSGTITASESTTISIINFLTGSDVGTFSATETALSSGAVTAFDSGTISALEVGALYVIVSSTDSGTLSAIDMGTVATFTGTVVKVWAGDHFEEGVLAIWDGTNFVYPPIRVWTGTDWILV